MDPIGAIWAAIWDEAIWDTTIWSQAAPPAGGDSDGSAVSGMEGLAISIAISL